MTRNRVDKHGRGTCPRDIHVELAKLAQKMKWLVLVAYKEQRKSYFSMRCANMLNVWPVCIIKSVRDADQRAFGETLAAKDDGRGTSTL